MIEKFVPNFEKSCIIRFSNSEHKFVTGSQSPVIAVGEKVHRSDLCLAYKAFSESALLETLHICKSNGSRVTCFKDFSLVRNPAVTMEEWNHNISSFTHFVIAGIPEIQDIKSRIILFVLFLVIYTITVIENLIFIIVIKSDHGLHSPMYLFICNLAILDLLIPSVTVPEMLYYLITEDRSIAFGPCITQMAFYLTFLVTEAVTLVVMAYDRYQAICNPLHYPTVMTTKHAFMLSALCWMVGCVRTIPYIYFVLNAPFCGPNRIEYFCCDYVSIMLLACADVSVESTYDKIVSLMLITVQLFLILFSYRKITVEVSKISSSEGQRKAFSTCASHLLVISVFYLAVVFVLISYSVPGFSEQVRTLAALVQNVLPPLANPVIYCIKTKEIRTSITKLIKKY
ncbi:olfactory receptor 6N1-like [Protopterus annectens]|uniref:olfactory receptor 6N1-like n=1 Tax=Protopterus annectens TaxID=7888 RepID=UPI001CFB2912|nr:olfactory receptor 6N1-like [Protopterus annectens]